MSTGFIYTDKGKTPPKGPKNGTTDACAHEGCQMVLRYKNGGWLHSIRARYDHQPQPVHHEAATALPPMDAFAAMAVMNTLTTP